MSWIGRLSVLVTLGIVCGAPPSWSQDARDDALKRAVEQRFDVLPLRDGLALHPKTPIAGVRSIEIAGGTIAIDGQPATGAELRARLGASADQVLQLSYLTDEARRALFSEVPATSPAPSAPAASQAAPPEPPAVAPPPPPIEPTRRARPRRPFDRRDGDRVRIGGGITVEEGEIVEGDVVAVGGPVVVNGEVQGDVVSVGGGVTLGPNSLVERNVAAIGGSLRREPGARVGGRAQEIAIGLDFGRWSWRQNPVALWWGARVGSAFALVGALVRVAVLCLFAALVVLFGRDYMERAGSVAASDSLKAGAVGLLAQILFIPLLVITCIVLVVTIVGIPLLLLLPFVLLGLAIAGLIGFSGVAYRIGGLAVNRLGWPEQNVYAVTMIGVLLIMLPVLLSRLASVGGGFLFPIAIGLAIAGAIVEYLAWTVGFGAMALARFRQRRDGRTGDAGPAIGDSTSLPSPSAS